MSSCSKIYLPINFQGLNYWQTLPKKEIKRFILHPHVQTTINCHDNFPIEQVEAVSYAETKIDCEKYCMLLPVKHFTSKSRFGTAYGISFRTRFDLLVNPGFPGIEGKRNNGFCN